MQEEIHMGPDITKRGRARKKKSTKPSEITPHDGDVFTISLDNGKSYIGQVIATPNDVNTYIVIFSPAIDEKDVDQHVDSALTSPPLLAGLTISPFEARPTWKIIASRQLSKRDKDRFLPAYYAHVAGKRLIEDFYRERSRPATPDEASAALSEIVPNKSGPREEKTISFQRVYSPAAFEIALKAINGLETWNERYAELYADRIVLQRDIFGPRGS